MNRARLIHTLFLLALPLLVALLGLSAWTAFGLILLVLLWRWALALVVIASPADAQGLVLETITASHFVEKVRWCMDRLGLDYREQPCGGTLGAFFLGRTVPVLHFPAGAVRSSIGSSSEILRYLWGQYGEDLGEKAEFMRPTANRVALEKRLDRIGVDLQVWVYSHILAQRKITLRAWGIHNPAIPAWQRLLLAVLFPLLRFMIRKAFAITPGHIAKAIEHIENMLTDTEKTLASGSLSVSEENELNYSDFCFAAIMGLWLQPPGYGGGRADTVRIERRDWPPAMREQVERWEQQWPLSAAHIRSLYETDRV